MVSTTSEQSQPPQQASKMHISALYIYPIKSLRGVSLPSALLHRHGFPYDRRFMLLKDNTAALAADPSADLDPLENMHIGGGFPSMCLFTTSLSFPDPATPDTGTITVTHRDPTTNEESSFTIPLIPTTSHADLAPIEVTMHSSRTASALRMPPLYNQWFSARFGFPVLLVWLRTPDRAVLGNVAPGAAVRNPLKARRAREQAEREAYAKTWTGALYNRLPSFVTGARSASSHPPSNPAANGEEDEDEYTLTFADQANYLITSSTSLDNISARLTPDSPSAEHETMDMTKFRPNIVIAGSPTAFSEDFWGELCISSCTSNARLSLTANCVRCSSINVSYATGAPSTGPAGQALKRMQKDRRVDGGQRWSPVFGRYGFFVGAGGGEEAERGGEGEAERGKRWRDGVRVSVGDEVAVSRWNEHRTALKWPGFGGTKVEELWPV